MHSLNRFFSFQWTTIRCLIWWTTWRTITDWSIRCLIFATVHQDFQQHSSRHYYKWTAWSFYFVGFIYFSSFSQIYFGTAHARIYLFANLLGINCATGMSALMKKECIENAGGLRHFGRYLAEDYFLAQEILNQGKKIGICGQPAWQNPGTSTIEALHDRMVRWTQLRLAMVFSARFEPLTECL